MNLTFKKLALMGAHAARGVARVAGLTAARYEFLAVLRERPLCQREVAERLCCSEAVVSRMVRALLQRGLVERLIPVRDRRYRVVRLTAAGHRAYDKFFVAEHIESIENEGSFFIGEGYWADDWQGRFGDFDVRALWLALEQHKDPPYQLLRLHLRARPYDDLVMGPETLWLPPEHLPPPPPLEGGLILERRAA